MRNWQLPSWLERSANRLLEGLTRSAAGTNSIRIGVRLRQLRAHNEWEVVARFLDHDGIPHARIRNLNDLGTTKVLSCTALLNRRRFRLMT